MSMTRRRLLDDTFKKSVVGNPAIATDSLAGMYPGIVMNGWTTQESTTGAQLFDKSTIEPGKYVFDTDGKIYDTSSNYKTAASDYVLVSGLSYICATVTSYRQWMAFYDSEKTYISGKTGYSVPIAVPEGAVYARFTISNDYIDSFMVNEGQVLLTYEPYTDGKPSPSPEYPQQIISAGTYNQETGKWEYEITIENAQTDPTENQTVTITADRPLTKWDRLEKRNGQWGWVYKSAEIESYTDESVPGEYFSTTGQLSAGAQVWYETETETFVPLTTAEQESMNSLYTYRPTTVLSNQQDCQIALTYKTRKGVGGGNLLDYRKLVNPAYWIGKTTFYVHFDITLKSNTTYRLSCTVNNIRKSYYESHPGLPDSALYLGEVENGFNGNVGFGHANSNDIAKNEYEFTTTENPYYINLYVARFSIENLHIVFDELLPGLKLQEVT